MESVQDVINYLESRIAELEKEHREYHPGLNADNWDEGDVGYSWAITELNSLLEKIRERKRV